MSARDINPRPERPPSDRCAALAPGDELQTIVGRRYTVCENLGTGLRVQFADREGGSEIVGWHALMTLGMIDRAGRHVDDLSLDERPRQ